MPLVVSGEVTCPLEPLGGGLQTDSVEGVLQEDRVGTGRITGTGRYQEYYKGFSHGFSSPSGKKNNNNKNKREQSSR